ncbi:diacylglycerol o-acyltransferase 2a [Diplodia corticola]|uniref:diacylglycerol O-acyltransferase n=1 Tax=Diplodia corticola TaxID=236234 RepID=A0A1J9RWT8_9PEZI|nr:diacylglycerol o-acyltransferase 2a [Diplodia corticola]OJD32807.1 diacylglycerol o-acyltransferase 2a [Diplodia corticola]
MPRIPTLLNPPRAAAAGPIVTMSQNASPSQPQDRLQADLEPKSYAAAAEKPADAGQKKSKSSKKKKQANGIEKDASVPQPQDDLPVPQPPVSEKSFADVAVAPPVQSQVDGVSTLVNGHTSSETPDGPKDASKTEDEKKVIYEKLEGPHGVRLTSVKPDDEFEKEQRQDENKEEKPELTSGREAGKGWERSSIRWAPLNVPLHRRLQTLMVLVHSLSIVGMLTIFFFLCSIPFLWPVLFPYTLFVLFSSAGQDGTLAYRKEWIRRLPVWSLYASYFPARLHRTQELPATRKYIFGYHPHGIISHGAFAAFATEALGFSQLFPGIINTVLTLDSNFRIPLYRDYALRLGIGSVSRESCENLLSKGGPNGEGMGRAITIVIGGARESLDAEPGRLRLVLARRKGFVKMAIRTGADLVPVLCFGENELYEQLNPQEHPRVHRFQLLVKKLMGFTIPIFHARGVFNYDVGMMPYRRPLNVVVGRPVQIVQSQKPDQAYVDEVHTRYVEELQRIWDEWKDTFAKDRTGELEIVE